MAAPQVCHWMGAVKGFSPMCEIIALRRTPRKPSLRAQGVLALLEDALRAELGHAGCMCVLRFRRGRLGAAASPLQSCSWSRAVGTKGLRGNRSSRCVGGDDSDMRRRRTGALRRQRRHSSVVRARRAWVARAPPLRARFCVASAHRVSRAAFCKG